MRCFKDRMPCDVINIRAGSYSDAAYLGCKCVTEIIAIQVECSYDIKIFRPGKDLLHGYVCDSIFDQDACAGFSIRYFAPWATIYFNGSEKIFCNQVTPVTKSSFGEFHDVAFMHNGNTLLFMLDGVRDGTMHKPFRSEVTHRFDPNAYLQRNIPLWRPDTFQLFLPALSCFFGTKTNFFKILRKFFGKKIKNLFCFRRTGSVFNAAINIFGVLTK